MKNSESGLSVDFKLLKKLASEIYTESMELPQGTRYRYRQMKVEERPKHERGHLLSYIQNLHRRPDVNQLWNRP